MESPGILVEDVRRSFGRVQAVRAASFAAPAGAVTGLIGPNGSGKTTLLLMLASLLALDAGRITVGGVDPVADPAAARARLGWMPDALGAWGSLSSRETLRVSARLYGMTATAAAVRADELLDRVGLADLADAPARVLSRGQKQRLGLGRALVHDPAVLLLDEPASGLDPQARIDLRILLRALAAEGRTILLSSHILAELDEVADGAVFLREGRTVAPQAAAPTARLWRVQVLDTDPAAAAAALTGVLGVEARPERRDVLVPIVDEAAAADALRRLVAAGIPVTGFAPAVGAFEQTYLDLEDRA